MQLTGHWEACLTQFQQQYHSIVGIYSTNHSGYLQYKPIVKQVYSTLHSGYYSTTSWVFAVSLNVYTYHIYVNWTYEYESSRLSIRSTINPMSLFSHFTTHFWSLRYG